MATITTGTATRIVGSNSFLQKRSLGVSASPVLGLPAIAMKGRVKCVAEEKSPVQEKAAHLAAICAAATAAVSSPAMALVDDRMSTEGTGLPFGLSNNLLVWILLGVFGLIWAFYSVYTSSLDEDEESGLSL
ncbi:hypothetical protein MLD38_031840 [Melastoma candidum]|uniref:Uncharacterized protein n=1 Tax=Melastoma candidum TaxID=119954 RepID=A0ACB9MQX8_9MYRT|nr:hypothetical protein MLD38_031840 [Melastoma candidum]